MALYFSILAGKFYEQRSLEGYSPWGSKSRTRLKQVSTCTPNTQINSLEMLIKFQLPITFMKYLLLDF